MSIMLVPAPLPIGNKQGTCSPGSPSKGGEGKGGYGGKANKRSGKGGRDSRDWADFTPTPSPWLEYTPTPWGGVDPYGFGMASGAAPGADAGLMPPPPHMSMGLPLQAPPRVAAMAAAAAAAAAGAAAAAAAACDVNAQATGGTSTEEFAQSETSSPPKVPIKNTFIHVADTDDADEFGLPSRAKTMPELKKKPPPTPQAVAPSIQVPSPSIHAMNTAQDLEEGNAAAAAAQDGAPLSDNLPSRGAALHDSGRCRPCAWFWKPQGCHNERECSYCHLCLQTELKARKKTKVAAMRMGALLPANKSPGQPARNNGAPSRVLKLSPLI